MYVIMSVCFINAYRGNEDSSYALNCSISFLKCVQLFIMEAKLNTNKNILPIDDFIYSQQSEIRKGHGFECTYIYIFCLMKSKCAVHNLDIFNPF